MQVKGQLHHLEAICTSLWLHQTFIGVLTLFATGSATDLILLRTYLRAWFALLVYPCRSVCQKDLANMIDTSTFVSDDTNRITSPPNLNVEGVSRQICNYRLRSLENGGTILFTVVGIRRPVQDMTASTVPGNKKRRRSTRILVSKKRKIGDPSVSSLTDDQNTVTHSLYTSSLYDRVSYLNEEEESTSSSTISLASDEDFLNPKGPLAGLAADNPAGDTDGRNYSQLVTPPPSEPGFYSELESDASLAYLRVNCRNIAPISTHQVTSQDHNSSAGVHRRRSPTMSPEPIIGYGQSNNNFPREYWFPSPLHPQRTEPRTILPDYRFVAYGDPSLSIEEKLASDEMVTSWPPKMAGETAGNKRSFNVPKLSSKAPVSRLPSSEKNLLDIKLRPVASSVSRAIPEKQLPPLYVPILPPTLAWCLVPGAHPDPEEHSITDEVAVRAARHLTGLRVLKRNAAVVQGQERAQGRNTLNQSDGELLREYVVAMTKRKSAKRVSFDDSAARIVLADWKGISVENL